jgi:outer membrane protein OmpA-like peptidoglycan-associated protein
MPISTNKKMHKIRRVIMKQDKIIAILTFFFAVLLAFSAEYSHAERMQADEFIKIWAPPVKSGTRLKGSYEDKAQPPVASLGETQLPFTTNSAQLMPQAEKQVHEIAAAMLSPQLSEMTFTIVGHADPRGGERHNQILSEKRAQAVRQFLVGLGVPIERIKAQGFGEKYAMGSDDATWAIDRRVDIFPFDFYEQYVESLARFKASSLFVDVDVFCRDARGLPKRIAEGVQLKSGDKFRIFFKPKQDCHVRVFQVDSAGKVDQKYPKKGKQLHQVPSQASQEYWVPGFSEWLELDKVKGEERIYVVATHEPVKQLDNLTTSAISKGKRLKIKGTLGPRERVNAVDQGIPQTSAPQQDMVFSEFERILKDSLPGEQFFTSFSIHHR